MLRPENEDELAEMVRGAAGPLRIEGGGTRPVGVTTGEVLSTAGLSGITLYEPGALTLVARAGTPVAEVEAALAAEGQRLPFEPMDHRALMGTGGAPTMGGMAAANASGPRRIQAGACRDSLIGVRFVDGTGAVVKNGGRVMKNVTGYDLVKLMAGARGTLGVLSEVAVKVLPRPAAQVTLRLRGLDAGRAVQAMSAALGSPYEVTGAAHRGQGAAAETLLRLEGFESQIAHRRAALSELMAPYGAVEVEDDGAAGDALWREIRDVSGLAAAEEDVWRVSVRPSDAPEAARRLEAARLLFDWGGGLIWAATDPGLDLRAALAGVAGHATLVRAAPETHAALGTFAPEAPPLAAISHGLRARFDPRGILNPGLMG
ncbi:glycolate oxidase FAD binding subunit [Tranquillimonas rosea]|uniref:Glycolate oxidase FAD binding subunit n=1 Tax=Tranquillimonas rosea TaxID=641238 RepID=A0A1H9R5E0_9RHOB|nr:glycolate oxidase FAD binding subunit [Tranquillimonas rosea]